MLRINLSLVCVSLLAAACTSPAPRSGAGGGQDPALQRVLASLEAKKQEMRISPQDLIAISVYREPDLRKETRVNADGKISFPLAGEVVVGGLTPLEAEGKLKEKLDAHLVDAQVSVQVKEYRAREAFVLGEVVKPGSYEIPPDRPLTVVEAIALSGGLTRYASGNRTRVVRRNGDEFQSIVIPVNKITAGDKSKDIALRPGDVVYVPTTLF